MPVLSTITAAAAVTMDTLRRLLAYARDAEGAFRAWLDVLIRETKATALLALRELQQARAALVRDLKKARAALESTTLEMPPTGEHANEKVDTIECESATTASGCVQYKGTIIHEYVYESTADSATDSATEEEEEEEEEYEEEEESEQEEEEEEGNGEGEGEREGEYEVEEEEEEPDAEEEEEEEQALEDPLVVQYAAMNAATAKKLDNAEAELTVPRQCVLVLPELLVAEELIMSECTKVTKWLTALGVPFTPKIMSVDVDDKNDPYFTNYKNAATENSHLPYIFVEDAHGSNSENRVFVDHVIVEDLYATISNHELKHSAVALNREKYVDATLMTRLFFLGVAKPNAKGHADDA
jgi:hypothetical protein